MSQTKGNSKSVKRIVILGAGSAGISTALTLKKMVRNSPWTEIVLLDRSNYHAVLPLLYQVVTGSVAPPHISFPLRKLFMKRGSSEAIAFRQSRIKGIDAQKKIVITDEGELTWDYLVIALGSTTNFFGMSDVEEVALTFRSMKDGIAIHNRIVDNYEKALWTEDEQAKRALLTFVIVGGGPTGVELAAHVREFADKVEAKQYPSLSKFARVILMEGQDSLLTGMNSKTRELAVSRLKSNKVDIMLKTRLVKAWQSGVQTADGETISTQAVIWCAGIKPVSIVKTLPFDKARDGRIIINNYLQVPGASGVYALGDCAYLEQANGVGPYPPTFQVAYRQGGACARNIINAIKGEPLHPYNAKFLGQVFYVNRNTAIAQLFGLVFDGYPAGMIRRTLFIGMLIYYGGIFTGLKNKLSAALDWLFAYFYNRNTAHLE